MLFILLYLIISALAPRPPSTMVCMIDSWSWCERCSLRTNATHDMSAQHSLLSAFIHGCDMISRKLILSLGSRFSIDAIKLNKNINKMKVYRFSFIVGICQHLFGRYWQFSARCCRFKASINMKT